MGYLYNARVLFMFVITVRHNYSIKYVNIIVSDIVSDLMKVCHYSHLSRAGRVAVFAPAMILTMCVSFSSQN